MHHYRQGTDSGTEPSENTFSGHVRIEGYFHGKPPGRASGAIVHFAPRARTPWKINPIGQVLVVTSGEGKAQSQGGPILSLVAGDIVRCDPGIAHWEGAASSQAMTCVIINEGPVSFEHAVSDEEYDMGNG